MADCCIAFALSGETFRVWNPRKGESKRLARKLWETHSGLDGIAVFATERTTHGIRDVCIYSAGATVEL